MRRLLFITALFFTICAFPRQLTPDEAYNRCLKEVNESRQNAPSAAMGFQTEAAIGLPPTSKDLRFRSVADTKGETRLYLFDTGGSFMIASADESAIPVLAYGDSPLPDPEDMPPAMKEWLDFYAQEIAYAASLPGAANEQEDNRAYASRASLPSIAKIVKSTWDQIPPYSDKCPIYSGKVRCFTGCTATAAAQIMYVHKYPDYGTGTYTHSDEIQGKNNTWTINFGNTQYRWADMTQSYNSKSKTAAKEAVATLMQHLGVASKMDYDYLGINQSGASLTNMGKGLIRNFGYSKAIRYEQRKYFSPDEWRLMVHAELSAGRPILYEGNSGNDSGHAFVCDGYDSKSDKFHFNWGWSGNGDGFYALTALKPAVISGTGGSNYNYTENQAALFGIAPPKEGDCYYPLISIKYGITCSNPMASAGNVMSLIVCSDENSGFYSYVLSEESYQFITGLELKDKSNGSTYYFSSTEPIELKYLYGKHSINFKCDTSGIPQGEYVGRPVVKSCDDSGSPVGSWEYVRIPSGAISSLDVYVGKHYVAAHNAATSSPLLTAKIISCPETARYADEFFVEADITCKYADFSGKIEAAACSDGSISTVTLGHSELRNIPAGETVRVRIPCRLSSQTSDSIELCLKYSNNTFCDGPEMMVENVPAEVSFIPNNAWPDNVVPGENFTLTGDFHVDAAPLSGDVECSILNADGEICAQAERSNHFNLRPGESAKMSFNFDGLSEEGTYTVKLTFGDQSLIVDRPVIVGPREFSIEAEYPEVITKMDWSMSVDATVTLLSGSKYEGYLNYEISGPNDFSLRDSRGNYVSLSKGSPTSTNFYIRTDDLDLGDYQIQFYLSNDAYEETGLYIGSPFPFSKIEAEGRFVPGEEWPESVVPGEQFTLTGEFFVEKAPISESVDCRILNAENKVCAECIGYNYCYLDPGESRELRFYFDGLPEKGEYAVELFFGNQVIKVDYPIMVKDREFSLEADYKKVVTQDDWTMGVETTLTLLSGNKYQGYLNYEITGPDDFRQSESYGNYVSLSHGESKSSHFTIWIDKLDFGDYVMRFYLSDDYTGDGTRTSVGDAYHFIKSDKAGINAAESAPEPTIEFSPERMVILRNIPAGTAGSVLTPDGAILHRFTVDSDDIYLCDYIFRPGIYIIRAGNLAFKFRF
ncbi:MAG: C10 family peptidase [Muribaculaceae bacterium]|nr:C10 family peptidase [Muribaculaceae bacterium]